MATTHAWLPAQPQVLAYGAGKLWATVGADALARIDPETKVPVTVRAERRTGQLDLSGHYLVVAGPTSNEVLVFDVRRWGRDLEPKTLPVGLNPYAVEAQGKHVWVTGLAGKWLTRLDR
jgi:hypothetical protein